MKTNHVMNLIIKQSKMSALKIIVIEKVFIAVKKIGATLTLIQFIRNANKIEHIAMELNVNLVENAIQQFMKIKIDRDVFSMMHFY